MNPTPTRGVSVLANQPGAALSRFLICLQQAEGFATAAATIAEKSCRTTPAVEQVFRYAEKAAVAAGSTSSFGDALTAYGIGREAFLLLQSASLFGRLSATFRRVPFRTKTPRELGAGAGASWRGEGLPRALTSSLFDNLQMEFHEADALVVVTREAFRFGNDTEKNLRDAVIAAVAKYIDAQLLDPSVSATAAHPASLTNSGAVVTSTGSSAAQIIADLSSLIAAIQSPGDGLRWVMRPTSYFTICAKLAGVGYPTPPGFLLNIPVVLGSTSPQQITLVDGSSIAYATDETMDLDLSTQATLEMDNAPTQDGTAGTGAQLVSLYQSGLVAIKAELAASWQSVFSAGSPLTNSGVAYMTTSY